MMPSQLVSGSTSHALVGKSESGFPRGELACERRTVSAPTHQYTKTNANQIRNFSVIRMLEISVNDIPKTSAIQIHKISVSHTQKSSVILMR